MFTPDGVEFSVIMCLCKKKKLPVALKLGKKPGLCN